MIVREIITESRLNEIEAMSGASYNPISSEFRLDSESSNFYKKAMKKLPGSNDYTYVVDKSESPPVITILDPNNLSYIVAELKLKRKSTLPEQTTQVSTIMVHPKYRGKGIAKALYGIALLPKPDGLGLTLVSDERQTPGGVRNWVSLSQIPGVEVTGIVALPKFDQKKFDASPITQQSYATIMNDLIGNIGGVYYGENNYKYFYQIPVKLIGSKLENVIEKSLIKIYPKDFVDGIYYETLLMAKYEG